MKIVRGILEMQHLSTDLRIARNRIGFVPTMGALHKGHCALLKTVQEQCDVSVMSIFVNPTQFAPGEDFDRYPKTLESDAKACESGGVDLIFAPLVRGRDATARKALSGLETRTKRLRAAVGVIEKTRHAIGKLQHPFCG